MKLFVAAIFDSAAGVFNTPLFFRARGEAIRAFTNAVRNPDSDWAKSKSDYHLMFLGSFDDNSGTFENPSVPERIISANEVDLS